MSYTVREVSAMLGLSAAQIRSFASKGFLQPERGPRGELRFGFHDLVILRTAGELAAAKVPQRKRSEEHTSELQSLTNLVCRLLLEKKKKKKKIKQRLKKKK